MELPSWIDWPAANREPAATPPPPTPPATKPKRKPAVWRPMTGLELRAALELGHCRLPVASSTKRIARNLAAQAEASEPRITDKQAPLLWKFCWKFRRQIRDQAVVREATRRHAEEQS